MLTGDTKPEPQNHKKLDQNKSKALQNITRDSLLCILFGRWRILAKGQLTHETTRAGDQSSDYDGEMMTTTEMTMMMRWWRSWRQRWRRWWCWRRRQWWWWCTWCLNIMIIWLTASKNIVISIVCLQSRNIIWLIYFIMWSSTHAAGGPAVAEYILCSFLGRFGWRRFHLHEVESPGLKSMKQIYNRK